MSFLVMSSLERTLPEMQQQLSDPRRAIDRTVDDICMMISSRPISEILGERKKDRPHLKCRRGRPMLPPLSLRLWACICQILSL